MLQATCVVAAVAPATARADWIYFKDGNPTKISVVSNLFVGARVTLDGRKVFDKSPYMNTRIDMPKSKRITFTGTDSYFDAPYDFSTDYIFVSRRDPSVPIAELDVTGVAAGYKTESISGYFKGFGDHGLPARIPEGSTVIVVDRHALGIQFGPTPQSITISYQPQLTR
jgi:hypothetical protein